MRIRSTSSVPSSPQASSAEKADRVEAATSAAPTKAPVDTASIMGVPEAELTPNVQRALLALMSEVDQLRKEADVLRAKIRDLETLADRDVMLPVLNRRAFLREVSKSIALADRHNAPSALIYLDLNGFKAINDTHGHAAGDAALEAITERLVAHLRETDAIGRLGGDEFAIVLTLTPTQAAETKAAELAEIIADTRVEYKGQTISLTAAWGVHALERGTRLDEALAEADRAMYERKAKAAQP